MIEMDDEPDFDFGSREYREFFSRFGLSPFQHPDWLGPFYQLLPAAAGKTPLVIVGRDTDTGRLCAVIPLLKDKNGTNSRVTFAFLGVTDYACPVIDPSAFGQLSLQKDLHRLVGNHALEIAPIHNDHQEIWSNLLGHSPISLDFGSHALVLKPPEDQRQGSCGVRTIDGLRRKARRLAERGDLRIEAVTGSEAAESIQTARRFRAGRFHDDPLQVDTSAAFYSHVAGSRDGLSRTFRLMCGGSVVAVLFGLVHMRRFHYIILACDYSMYAKYSPGLLIMDLAIQAWDHAGGEVFDFTIGDEPFKAKFGCIRTPMFCVQSGF